MTKILIVDDHQLVLDGLRLIIESQNDLTIVAEAHNGQEAFEIVAQHPVDLILMDLNMPILNGMEASKIILEKNPNIKILILSMLSDKKLVQKLVKRGVKGYMLKNSGQDEILSAIRKILSGETYFDSHIIEMMMNISKESKGKKASLFPTLSRREKEILQLIIEENTSSEIAEKLFIGVGTVDSHRRNMISKLGVRNTAGMVSAAYEYDLLH